MLKGAASARCVHINQIANVVRVKLLPELQRVGQLAAEALEPE